MTGKPRHSQLSVLLVVSADNSDGHAVCGCNEKRIATMTHMKGFPKSHRMPLLGKCLPLGGHNGHLFWGKHILELATIQYAQQKAEYFFLANKKYAPSFVETWIGKIEGSSATILIYLQLAERTDICLSNSINHI